MSYDDEAAMASEMIADFGGVITISSTRYAAANATTDRPAAPPTKLTASPKAVCLPVKHKYVGADLFQNGIIIRISHRTAYIAGPDMSWEPLAGDTVVAEGKPWKVIGMLTIRPDNGVPVLHILFYQA